MADWSANLNSKQRFSTSSCVAPFDAQQGGKPLAPKMKHRSIVHVANSQESFVAHRLTVNVGLTLNAESATWPEKAYFILYDLLFE